MKDHTMTCPNCQVEIEFLRIPMDDVSSPLWFEKGTDEPHTCRPARTLEEDS
jgi:hypothetical protein